MKHLVAYEGRAKVALGAMSEEYVPLYAPWINARVCIDGTTLRPPYSIEGGKAWVRGLDARRGQDEVFAVLLKGGDCAYRYVGHMGLHRIKWPDGTATTGSVIGDKAAREAGGVGTEAKLLLLYHAFEVLGLKHVSSTVKVFNRPSAGHMLKCGYRYVGRYRKRVLHNGALLDELIFEVLPEDWKRVWDRYQATGGLPKLSDEQRAFIMKEMAGD